MPILFVFLIAFYVFAKEKTEYRAFPDFGPMGPKNWCSGRTTGSWEVHMVESKEIDFKTYYIFVCTFDDRNMVPKKKEHRPKKIFHYEKLFKSLER